MADKKVKVTLVKGLMGTKQDPSRHRARLGLKRIATTRSNLWIRRRYAA
jgi:hypothetical protein